MLSGRAQALRLVNSLLKNAFPSYPRTAPTSSVKNLFFLTFIPRVRITFNLSRIADMNPHDMMTHGACDWWLRCVTGMNEV